MTMLSVAYLIAITIAGECAIHEKIDFEINRCAPIPSQYEVDIPGTNLSGDYSDIRRGAVMWILFAAGITGRHGVSARTGNK